MKTHVMGDEVSVGYPVAAGPLELFPLFGSDNPEHWYFTGILALSLEVCFVRERPDGPSVGHLVVDVTGRQPVLLIEGETLLGARQNRTLNLSVLCPPGETVIPVSCLEQGRWGDEVPVQRSQRHAPSKLRSYKISHLLHDQSGEGHSSQAEVWAEVSRQAEERGVRSPSESLEEVFDAEEASTAEALASLTPLEGQTGVLVCADGAVLGLDLFSRSSTLAQYLPSLARGYLLDAGARPLPCPAEDVDRFLASLAEADTVAAPSPGLGDQIVLRSPRVVGQGLRHDGVLVHFAAFPVPVRG